MPRIRLRAITVSRGVKRAAIALLALAVIAAVAGIAHDPVVRVLARTGNPLYDMNKAAWVWDATLIAPAATPTPAPATSQSFVDRLVGLNINRIFLNAGWEPSIKAAYLATKPAEYDQFIKAAHAKGIGVEALFGEPNFAKAEHWAEFERHVNLVLDYNKQHSNRFTALHLDVEPYGCSDYRGHEATILKEYLAGLQKVREMINKHNTDNRDHLKLVLDLPVWWDANQPKVDGQALLPQLLKLADEAVIMNYTADSRQFISQGQRWLDTAAQLKAKVTIGMEFQPEIRGATMFALTPEEIQVFLQTALKQFSESKQFTGIAVHHFGAFSQYCQAKSQQGGTKPR